MTDHTAPLPDRLTLPAFQHGFSAHWMDVDRDPGDWFVDVIGQALEAGYRRIDCNPAWDTEPMVGAAIARAPVPREDIFLTTVVPYPRLGAREARESILASLERLRLDRLDLALVSAPLSGWDIDGTAAAMNALVESGVVSRVGARYMSLPDLDAFTSRLSAPLYAHLTELHPLWQAVAVRRHAVTHGYWVLADGPLMQGMVREVREIRAVATRSGATPWQVALAWLHQLPNVASSTWTHHADEMRSNLGAADVVLDPASIGEIGAIDRRWSGVPHLHPVADD